MGASCHGSPVTPVNCGGGYGSLAANFGKPPETAGRKAMGTKASVWRYVRPAAKLANRQK